MTSLLIIKKKKTRKNNEDEPKHDSEINWILRLMENILNDQKEYDFVLI